MTHLSRVGGGLQFKGYDVGDRHGDGDDDSSVK